MKDHEIAALINQVRDVAKEFGQTQQLRERLASILVPILKTLPEPSAYIQLNSSGEEITISKSHLDTLPEGWLWIKDLWENAKPLYAKEHINNQGYEDEIFEIEE